MVRFGLGLVRLGSVRLWFVSLGVVETMNLEVPTQGTRRALVIFGKVRL